MVKGRVPADPKEEAELAVARVVEARTAFSVNLARPFCSPR
jgi:hypothetical protein